MIWLAWCTSSENIQHAYSSLNAKGRLGSEWTYEQRMKYRNTRALFTIDECSDIIELATELNMSRKDVANLVGCSVNVINLMFRNKIKCKDVA